MRLLLLLILLPLAPSQATHATYFPAVAGGVCVRSEKAGLAWASRLTGDLGDIQRLGVKRYHHWGPVGWPDIPPEVATFTPNLAGWSAYYVQRWADFLDANPGYTGRVFFLNEPDLNGWTPQAAADWWQQRRADCPACQWVGPHISELGIDWLAAFVDTYVATYGTLPPVAGWGFHGHPWQADEARAMLQGKGVSNPLVYITEWAIPQWSADPYQAAIDVINGYEARPWVAEYYLYTSRQGQGPHWTPTIDAYDPLAQDRTALTAVGEAVQCTPLP